MYGRLSYGRARRPRTISQDFTVGKGRALSAYCRCLSEIEATSHSRHSRAYVQLSAEALRRLHIRDYAGWRTTRVHPQQIEVVWVEVIIQFQRCTMLTYAKQRTGPRTTEAEQVVLHHHHITPSGVFPHLQAPHSSAVTVSRVWLIVATPTYFPTLIFVSSKRDSDSNIDMLRM